MKINFRCRFPDLLCSSIWVCNMTFSFVWNKWEWRESKGEEEGAMHWQGPKASQLFGKTAAAHEENVVGNDLGQPSTEKKKDE